MKVNEIFRSIQGESSYAGRSCIFIRLTGCNLRCNYCDTKYAYMKGTDMSINEIVNKVKKLYKKGDIIEITGGEPLLQAEKLKALVILLYGINTRKVIIETNGSIELQTNNGYVDYVMDWKCPSSGMQSKMHYENLSILNSRDELKFVIETDDDYDFMKKIIENKNVRAKVLVSTTWKTTILKRREFVERILKDGLQVRFQIQLHKLIWGSRKKGV